MTVSPAATTHGPGAGLGLAIVRALAEAHGGHATITDRSGDDRTGATVRVTLPLAPL
ncbi:MAG: ATP-binding protein [Ilumatobacteraceae bacterium]